MLGWEGAAAQSFDYLNMRRIGGRGFCSAARLHYIPMCERVNPPRGVCVCHSRGNHGEPGFIMTHVSPPGRGLKAGDFIRTLATWVNADAERFKDV